MKQVKKGNSNFFKGSLIVVGFFLLFTVEIMYSIWAYKYVVKDVWEWTILPYYNLTIVSDNQIVAAFIVIIIIKYLLGISNSSYDKDDDTFDHIFKNLLITLIKPWALFLTLYIIKWLFL